MRFFIWLVILFLSKLSFGQNIYASFDRQVIRESFDMPDENWDQRFTNYELMATQKGHYLMQNKNSGGISVSFPYSITTLKNAWASVDISLPKKGKNTGGMVLWANKAGNEAILIELSNKGKLRVQKISSTGSYVFTGTDDEGFKSIPGYKKKKPNTLSVKAENNYFDIYVNNVFIAGYSDGQVNEGRIGLFVSSGSVMQADNFSVFAKMDEVIEKPAPEKPKETGMDEVLLLFKNKIDQQEKEILKLQAELNNCKLASGVDTTARRANKELMQKNQELIRQVAKLEADMETNKKRLAYLESMKQDIEKSSNGDLVLSLTELLAKEKSNSAQTKEQNEKLKIEVFVLQKELEELKYRLSKLEKQ